MDYSTKDVRKFINSAFADQDLDAFCFDNFREVHSNFAAGLTKGQKIQALLVYCETRNVWPELLTGLRKERPDQFATAFQSEASQRPPGPQPGLPGSGDTPPQTGPTPPQSSQSWRDRWESFDYKWAIAILIAAAACVAAWLVVPQVQQWINPDKPTPTSTPVVIPTDTPTPTATATVTNKPTPTSTPTITPTPDPCACRGQTDTASLECLIQSESAAVVDNNLPLLMRIFDQQAVVVQGNTQARTEVPFQAHYKADLAKKDYITATHSSVIVHRIEGPFAYATSGNSGEYALIPDEARSQYANGSSSDHWTFGKNDLGCWVITRFEFNAVRLPFPPTPSAQEATPTQKP